MPVLERFDPPAFINDFVVGEESLRNAFLREWDRRVRCWFAVSQFGDAWSADFDSPRSRFFSPIGLESDDLIVPEEPVAWTAFPKRLNDFYANHPRNPRSDEGPPLTDDWRPSGPRGWQDEYCEWSVERNSDNKVTKVTFTCENPEYWETLWSVSPEKVRDLYRQYLNRNDIDVDDLILRRDDGTVETDRETGRPRYDRTNRFNRNRWEGGANGVMHLISPPNTLFAEIFLAGGATILREKDGQPVTDRDLLIECSAFGTPGRNSDPTIGFYVNDLVRSNNIEVALANPVGLYIAGLDTTRFTLPDNAPDSVSASDFWQIKRGTADVILRAEFFVPDEFGFVVEDIKIEGEPIKRGAQLAEHIQIKLSGVGRTALSPSLVALECKRSKIQTLPEPITILQTVSPSFRINRTSTQRLRLHCVGYTSWRFG